MPASPAHYTRNLCVQAQQSHQHGKQKAQSVTKNTGDREEDEDNTTYPYMASIQDAGLAAREGSAHEKTKLPKLSLNRAPGPIAWLNVPCEAGQGY